MVFPGFAVHGSLVDMPWLPCFAQLLLPQRDEHDEPPVSLRHIHLMKTLSRDAWHLGWLLPKPDGEFFCRAEEQFRGCSISKLHVYFYLLSDVHVQ